MNLEHPRDFNEKVMVCYYSKRGPPAPVDSKGHRGRLSWTALRTTVPLQREIFFTDYNLSKVATTVRRLGPATGEQAVFLRGSDNPQAPLLKLGDKIRSSIIMLQALNSGEFGFSPPRRENVPFRGWGGWACSVWPINSANAHWYFFSDITMDADVGEGIRMLGHPEWRNGCTEAIWLLDSHGDRMRESVSYAQDPAKSLLSRLAAGQGSVSSPCLKRLESSEDYLQAVWVCYYSPDDSPAPIVEAGTPLSWSRLRPTPSLTKDIFFTDYNLSHQCDTIRRLTPLKSTQAVFLRATDSPQAPLLKLGDKVLDTVLTLPALNAGCFECSEPRRESVPYRGWGGWACTLSGRRHRFSVIPRGGFGMKGVSAASASGSYRRVRLR